MKKLDKIVKVCNDCDGDGFVSSCCNAMMDGNKCGECGKFASPDFCCGEGYEEYKVGDEVDIFVCVYSSDYLKKHLYDSQKHGDSKTFVGKITKLIDNWTVQVKIKYKKIILEVDVEDISI